MIARVSCMPAGSIFKSWAVSTMVLPFRANAHTQEKGRPYAVDENGDEYVYEEIMAQFAPLCEKELSRRCLAGQG